MYEIISTKNDVCKEKYILYAEPVGEYGFPKLEPVYANFDGIKPVAFHEAAKERNPRKALVHFFLDDYRFSNLWNNCDKYIDILRNFKYVCSPDFSVYSNMPKTMQIWNVYRSRALAHYMTLWGISVIPTVTWSDESSYYFCFDGLPYGSTLAVSTNGCFTEIGRAYYRNGFLEMCKRLNPKNVLVIGREIPVDIDTEIIYMKSFGQEMTDRIESGGFKKWEAEAEPQKVSRA